MSELATAKTAQQAHGALGHQEPQQQPTPLVVDLNGTLIKTDSLLELFIVGLLRKPLSTLSCLGALLRGRGAFKRKVAEVGALSVAALPVAGGLRHLFAANSSGRAALCTS